jgi:glycosyltransferase involved in cell wall biosynthesis
MLHPRRRAPESDPVNRNTPQTLPDPASLSAPPLSSRVLPGHAPLRVAILCDYLEEGWPSMDLAGDMLHRTLTAMEAGEVASTQLRPEFHTRLARLPGVPSHLARNVDRLVNRLYDYPRWLAGRSGDFDLYHLVDHSYSQLLHVLPAERTVVTCHDLDTFKCLLEPAGEPRPVWFRAMARRILSGFQKAAHVICNSAATRAQLLRYELFPADRLTVVHVGLSRVFSAAPDPASDAEAARLLAPFAPGEIRLLSVGSAIPRKRIDILLRVFAAVRREFPNGRLIRVGGAFTPEQAQLARDLGVESSISILPFVASPVLAAIYRLCSLLLQPSDAEGFGMPLTEALACGCPVLASDIPPLREVGAGVCEYRPVGDVEGWTAAVGEILRAFANPPHLAAWRRNAAGHAAQYSWEENARRTIEVYRRVTSR